MAQIESLTQANTATVEQTAATAEELNVQARSLRTDLAGLLDRAAASVTSAAAPRRRPASRNSDAVPSAASSRSPAPALIES